MPAPRTLSAVLALGMLVLLLAGLRPGTHAASAHPRGPFRLAHPRVAGPQRRNAATPHLRSLLALTLAHVPAHSRWLASWGAAPEPAVRGNVWSVSGLDNQTIREIVMLSSDGAAVRVHLSNLYGNRPLLIGAASVAPAGPFGRLAGPSRSLTFAGATGTTIPRGGEAVSDPVVLDVHRLQRLAVSLYLPRETGPLTLHASAEQADFLGGRDQVGNPTGDWIARRSDAWYLLSGVDTLSPPNWAGGLATLGDSITAGFHSTPDTFGAWPDDLVRRLASAGGPRLSVIDEGISGNRILRPSPCCGASAIARFSRDVVDQAGIREVVFLEGTNDIGFAHGTSPLTAPHTTVSAAAIIAGDERIIAMAHRAGLRIIGATLLPFRGAFYWTPAGEHIRETVNRWILTSHAFDGVIDFAAAMAEPGHPERLNPVYDSGDHLHPDNAGYAAMARAVPLSLLAPGH